MSISLGAYTNSPRAVHTRRVSAVWVAQCLATVLLLMTLMVAGKSAARAQNATRSADAPLMKQVQQALSLDEHGDRQGAMAVTLQILSQNPKFAPAIKLKGMLLE